MVDVWIMLAAGLLGLALKRHGFQAAPIIMGLVLGGLVETSLAQSMILFDQDWTGFFSRPVALALFLLAAGSILFRPIRGLVRTER